MVITGGVDIGGNIVSRVTSYTFNQGFLADLPELNEARLLHGCTYFLNNENKIVKLNFQDHYQYLYCVYFIGLFGVRWIRLWP